MQKTSGKKTEHSYSCSSESESENDDIDAGTSEYQQREFIRCSIWQYLVILFGLFVLFWLALFPDSFPYQTLGGPGLRLKHLTDNYLVWMKISVPVISLIHVIEAVSAHYKCIGMSLNESSHRKWVMQTLLLGYTSIQLLDNYQSIRNNKLKKA